MERHGAAGVAVRLRRHILVRHGHRLRFRLLAQPRLLVLPPPTTPFWYFLPRAATKTLFDSIGFL